MFVFLLYRELELAFYCTELERKKKSGPLEAAAASAGRHPKGTALRFVDGLRAKAFTRTIAMSLPW